MNSLFNLLYRYRVAAVFFVLQVLCFLMIVSTNRFYSASFFNTSNFLSGSLNQFSQNSTNYFELDQINDQLALENAQLRRQLAELNYEKTIPPIIASNYEVIPGKVINKTYLRSANFLTLALGQDQGIAIGMGVVGEKGVVGRVKSVSDNFTTVVSILNPGVMISSQVKRTGTLCRVQWETNDPLTINVKDIPRHIPLFEGDTIETSSYNGVFPPGVLIGVIEELELTQESPFYRATARLSVDFSSLSYAHVIINQAIAEKDSIESIIIDEL